MDADSAQIKEMLKAAFGAAATELGITQEIILDEFKDQGLNRGGRRKMKKILEQNRKRKK